MIDPLGFGQENKKLSNKKQARYGTHGSKALNRETGAWFDFETWEGGYTDQEEKQDFSSFPLIVAKYDYTDEHNNLLYQVVRYAGHDFRQRRPDGNGGWTWSLKDSGLPEVLYKLPDVIKADEIVVVAGEKDCLNVAKATGMTATTNLGGENRPWVDDNTKFFHQKTVYIIPDNDNTGRKHAQKVASSLFSVAKAVRICDLCADMKEKADASDWLEENDPETFRQTLRLFPLMGEDTLDIFPTIDADAMQPSLSGDDFVEDLLISGAMSVLYGPSNSGKTFFATDLSLHIALGWDWRGKAVAQGSVVYLAMEGSYGIINRIVAFREYHTVAQKIPLAVVPVSVNFLDDDGIDKLINTIKVTAQRLGNVRMIVVDTLSRAMAGGDENGPKDMTAFVGAVDRLRDSVSAHVLIVHHTGKDEARGARGHSSLRAATDTEIEVIAGDGFSSAKVTKQRELEIRGEYGFVLSPHILGVNPRGKDVTSCVVLVMDDMPDISRKRHKRPAGKQHRIVLKALRNAMASESITAQHLPVDRAVSEEAWRRESYRLLSGDTKHKSTTFLRSADSLVADEFAGRDGDYCWPIEVK